MTFADDLRAKANERRDQYMLARRRTAAMELVGFIVRATQDAFAFVGLPRPDRGTSADAALLLRRCAAWFDPPGPPVLQVVYGVNDAVDFQAARPALPGVPVPMSAFVAPGFYAPAALATAVMGAMNDAATAAIVLRRFVADFDSAAQPKKFRIGPDPRDPLFQSVLGFGGGPNVARSISPLLGFNPADDGPIAVHVGAAQILDALNPVIVPSVPFIDAAQSRYGVDFDAGVNSFIATVDRPVPPVGDIREG